MSAREDLLRRLDADRAMQLDLFRRFVAAPSPNPPGDTREATAVLQQFLAGRGLDHRLVAPQAAMPNIVATAQGARGGRHLVLNGHIDVFPAGAEGWTHGPWSGDLADGAVWGRGTVDMKCGTSASVLAYAYLAAMRADWGGKLTLTCVSDEETGGKWGARYLLEHEAADCLGDCVLNGEPSSPHTVRFGEKGTLRLTFTVTTPGAHGAYPHLSPSATKIMGRLMRALESVTEFPHRPPPAVSRALADPATRASIDRGLGSGAADIMNRVTLNIGVLQGGLKVNMLPGDCRMEADIRLPVGLDKAPVMARIGEILRDFPEARVEEQSAACNPSNWCDPEGEMLRLIQRNARQFTGVLPAPTVTLGATDCKFWRYRGVPAYVYGPSPGKMSAPDENVTVEEFVGVLKTHVMSAYDYLAAEA